VTQTLAVRPEFMSLASAAPTSGNAVAARVVDLTYQGAQTRIALVTAGGRALVLVQPTADLPGAIAPDSPVWVAWSEDHGIYL
jgi:ABC-type Fe3+/spermidine/putrescine transport system ATPase subunit